MDTASPLSKRMKSSQPEGMVTDAPKQVLGETMPIFPGTYIPHVSRPTMGLKSELLLNVMYKGTYYTARGPHAFPYSQRQNSRACGWRWTLKAQDKANWN